MSYQELNSLQNFIAQVSDKLVKTVAALESDQVIEQMRNDKSLYKFKLDHIKEVIDEHFNFTNEITQLMNQNRVLTQEVVKLEQILAKKDQQFAQSIDIIDQSARKLTRENQQRIAQLTIAYKELEAKLNSQAQISEKHNRKNNELDQVVQSLEQSNEKLKKQLIRSKEEIAKLTENNRRFQLNLKQFEADHERSINLMKSENQKQIKQCQNLVKRMQNDMLIIKSQWQKKCSELQKGLKQFYQNQMVKLEQRKTRQLIQHFQTIKEGKPIIIKQDEELFNSKVECIRRQYEVEIQKIQAGKNQLQEIYQNLQNSQIPKIKEMERMSEEFKNLKTQYEADKDYWQTQKDKYKRESQKSKAIMNQFERNSKDLILQVQAKQSEIAKLQDNVKYIEKKLQITNRSMNEQKTLMNIKDDEIQTLKAKCACAEQLNKKNMKSILNLEGELQGQSKQIQALQRKLQQKNEQINKFIESQSSLKTQVKLLKSQKIKHRKMLLGLQRQQESLQNQRFRLKQYIKDAHQKQRKNIFTDLENMNKKIEAYRENVDKQAKAKINNLVNQIQQAKQAEQAQFQSLLRERDNLKRQVAELEELFQKKDHQMQEAKKTLANQKADAIKKSLTEELYKQKQRYQKLQSILENSQSQFHRRLKLTKAEVKDAVKVLTTKWMDQMGRLEEENKRKQVQLHRIVEKIQVVISQSEELKRNYEIQREQSKRLKKKYQMLKQEKDEQIADFIKRIEKQSKHKISLEKELRSIRSQLSRGERFQDYRQLQTENKNTGNSSITDRQKELTQIRELIAKTYQAVGEKPEKDTKYQRQRSPF